MLNFYSYRSTTFVFLFLVSLLLWAPEVSAQCPVDLVHFNSGSGGTTITNNQVICELNPNSDAGFVIALRFNAAPTTPVTVDWGDGVIEDVSSPSAREFTHTYAENTAMRQQYNVQVGACGFSRTFSINRQSIITLLSNINSIGCGTGATNAEFSLLGVNLSENTRWTINWGDGSSEIITEDDFPTNGEGTFSHSYAATATTSYQPTITSGNEINICASSVTPSLPTVSVKQLIDAEFTMSGSSICDDGGTLTITRGTIISPANLGADNRISWSIRNATTNTLLMAIPEAAIAGGASNPLPTGLITSYLRNNFDFTVTIPDGLVNAGDQLEVSLNEVSGCPTSTETKTVDVLPLPLVSGIQIK